MSDYKVLSDLLDRFAALSERTAKLETFEQPKYGQHIYKTAGQAILGAGWQTVSFDTSFWSNGDYSASPANTYVAPLAGRYLIAVHLNFTTAAALAFNVRINHNNTYYHIESAIPSVTGLLYITVSKPFNMAKGDTIIIEANNSGDAAAVNIGGSTNPYQSNFQSILL